MRSTLLAALLAALAGGAAAQVAIQGYVDDNGRWHESVAAGHYDDNGRWVVDPTPGHYDADGAWVAGPAAPSAAASGTDVAYTDLDLWSGAPLETRAREDWLERRIDEARDAGRLPAADARAALEELIDIRRIDDRWRRPAGELTPAEEQEILARLDGLRRQVHRLAE